MINIVHNMDCMEGMAKYPDNHFDLSIIDPPYGIGEDGRKNHTRGKLAKPRDYRGRTQYDNEPPPKIFFDEMMRVSKKQIIWGANHFISRMPFDSSCWIVWDKDNGNNDFADCELAWTSFKTAVRKFKFRWAGMLQEDMKNKEIIQHPNQKPVKLYKWLLTNYAKTGDKILDTHVGSGSSRIACYDMGFDFVGYEIDKDYWEAQEARFQKHISQPTIFEPDKSDTLETQENLWEK